MGGFARSIVQEFCGLSKPNPEARPSPRTCNFAIGDARKVDVTRGAWSVPGGVGTGNVIVRSKGRRQQKGRSRSRPGQRWPERALRVPKICRGAHQFLSNGAETCSEPFPLIVTQLQRISSRAALAERRPTGRKSSWREPWRSPSR